MLHVNNFLLSIIALHSWSFALHVTCISERNINQAARYRIYSSPDIPLAAHVIIIPIPQLNLQLHRAIGQREEVSAIAQRVGATIAVNGSNYRRGGRYNGNRLNLLMEHAQVYADLQHKRGSLSWDNTRKQAIIDLAQLNIELMLNKIALPVTRINQPRGEEESVLYTSNADMALMSYRPGIQVTIDDKHIITTIDHNVPSTIPVGWHVYQTHKLDSSITVGSSVHLRYAVEYRNTPSTSFHESFCIGGAGLLLHGGKMVSNELSTEFSQGSAPIHCHDEIAADFSTPELQDWMIQLRHPRSAVGITDNNEFCVVVVDGRHETSAGMTLHELAHFMQHLGCTSALNIGGGGCSTLYVDGKVVNHPSDGIERPVSEALCIMHANTSHAS